MYWLYSCGLRKRGEAFQDVGALQDEVHVVHLLEPLHSLPCEDHVLLFGEFGEHVDICGELTFALYTQCVDEVVRFGRWVKFWNGHSREHYL